VSLVVLDTDVASASFRNRVPERLRARLAGQTLCISFVTLGELTKWATLRSWGPRRLAELAEWRQHVAVLEYDEGSRSHGASCRPEPSSAAAPGR
jgi:predicted nucleic acid-binding protein